MGNKIPKNITISSETERLMVQAGISNLSKFVRDSIHSYALSKSNNPDDVNIEEVNLKLEELQEKKNELNSEEMALLNKKREYERAQREAKKQQILVQKKRIEKENKCYHCGNALGSGSHTVGRVQICDDCYHSQMQAINPKTGKSYFHTWESAASIDDRRNMHELNRVKTLIETGEFQDYGGERFR